jgi:hypothetical protein
MAGLVPAIHVFTVSQQSKSWMLGMKPGMTVERLVVWFLMGSVAWC